MQQSIESTLRSNLEAQFDFQSRVSSPSHLASILVDEIYIEKGLRYLRKSDCCVGLCVEHSADLACDAADIANMLAIQEALQRGTTHLAGQ